MSRSLILLLISPVPRIPAFYSWYAIIWSTTLHEVVLRTGTGSQTKTPLTVKKRKKKKKGKGKGASEVSEAGRWLRAKTRQTIDGSPWTISGKWSPVWYYSYSYKTWNHLCNLSIAYTAITSLQETCRLQNENNPVYPSSVKKKGVVIGYTTE